MGCGSPALASFARFYMFVAGVTFCGTALLSLARLLHISINIPNIEWSFAVSRPSVDKDKNIEQKACYYITFSSASVTVRSTRKLVTL